MICVNVKFIYSRAAFQVEPNNKMLLTMRPVRLTIFVLVLHKI